MSDNVNYSIRNRRRIEETIEAAADDEGILIGNMRCINSECEHEQVFMSPVKDWMVAPPFGSECEECGQQTSVFVLDDTLVRFESRRQRKERESG